MMPNPILMLKLCTALTAIAAGVSALPAAESEAEQTTQRLIYAQIVDQEKKDVFVERAVLEGKAFKHLLKKVSTMTNQDVRKAVDDRTILENLSDEADLHRGEAYAAGRGVIVEVAEAELTPDYG